jgi:hypothetical protein
MHENQIATATMKRRLTRYGIDDPHHDKHKRY